MKREDLKTKLVEGGVVEEKLATIIDYVMAQNGADINALKEEISSLKNSSNEKYKALEEENVALKSKVDGYKDYEDLKKFKADTIEKAENSKRVEFLKANGCKHPDLMIGKLDFGKAAYDEKANTYTGLDEDIKSLKENYGDLFEDEGTQRITPSQSGQSGNSFLEQYLKENPNMAKYIDK